MSEESELAAEVEIRSAEGFARAVEPHWEAMAAIAARAGDARDDVLQEALAAAWRRRRSYDPARGGLRGWLLAIAVDACSKHWRNNRHTTQPLDAAQGVVLDAGASRPQALDVSRALSSLTKRERLAVDLYYYADLGIDDTAAAMRCTPGTVKSTLASARTRLRAYLGEDYRDA